MGVSKDFCPANRPKRNSVNIAQSPQVRRKNAHIVVKISVDTQEWDKHSINFGLVDGYFCSW